MDARRLLSSTVLYGLSDVAVMAVGGFLLLPLYTHSLSQAEFGHYVAVRTNIDIATYLLQMGLPSAVARLYFDRRRAGQEHTYLSGILVLFLIVAVAIALLATMYGPAAWQALSPTVPAMPALPFTLAIAAAGGLSSLAIVWLRAEHRVAAVVSLQLGAAAVLAVVVTLTLTRLHMGLSGILIALLASAVIPALALPLLFGRNFRFTLRRSDVTETLNYAVPILVGYLAYFVLNRSSTLVLQHFVRAEELAIYGLAQQLSMITAIACTSFGAALQPAVFAADPGHVHELLDRASRLLTLLMLAVSSGLMLFANELIGLVAPHGYGGSTGLLMVLIAANFANTFTLLSDTALLYHRRPKTSVLISIASAVVAASLGLLLIPEWHSSGAALSVACGFTFRMIASQWMAWHISGQSQAALAIPAVLLLALVALTASLLRDNSMSWAVALPIKAMICALATGTLYLVQRKFISVNA